MLGRFGQILCWGATSVALFCAALVAYFALSEDPDRYFNMMVFGIFGATIWILGRALRYARFRR
jgi:hypothetical protein